MKQKKIHLRSTKKWWKPLCGTPGTPRNRPGWMHIRITNYFSKVTCKKCKTLIRRRKRELERKRR